MPYSFRAAFVLCLGLALAAALRAGDSTPSQQPFGDWTADAPGVRHHITAADLPRPSATKSAENPPHLIPRPKDAWPKAPAGFVVELLAERFVNPRKIIAAPNGDLFVAESSANRVSVLRFGADGNIQAKSVFADGLRQPFGIAFYPPGRPPTHVFIANTDSILRFPYKEGDLKAQGEAKVVVPDLPAGGKLHGGGHWTRDVVFMPDGRKMLVSVGSHSNNDDDEQETRRADILEYNPDGSGYRIFAAGIRNAVGLVIEPATGALWASVNERDGYGDDLVPDYITHVKDGGFYGWPWFYIGAHPDPIHIGKHPELAEKTIVPDVLLQPHSASLCMTFYSAQQFPADYRGHAFAAEHGSWNRSRRTGYKVIRVPMKDGQATGEYEDFLTGFVTPSGDVWGRPVGVAVGRDGALYVSDDGGNVIWRVRYEAAGQGTKP